MVVVVVELLATDILVVVTDILVLVVCSSGVVNTIVFDLVGTSTKKLEHKIINIMIAQGLLKLNVTNGFE